MSMTHFKRTLIHTCTIERRTDSQSESGELIPAWSNVSTATRCRYIQTVSYTHLTLPTN